jgi:hypothetical protein
MFIVMRQFALLIVALASFSRLVVSELPATAKRQTSLFLPPTFSDPCWN